jgi:hypothetical protein
MNKLWFMRLLFPISTIQFLFGSGSRVFGAEGKLKKSSIFMYILYGFMSGRRLKMAIK